MSLDYVFKSKEKDLGGFKVQRLLPMAQKRQVGPFVFLDHMGPFLLEGAKQLDVRPHPHIGLATVTFLFEGEAFHADSLGSQQRLQPGAINLMVAGSGIVHSERTPKEFINSQAQMHGVQIWLALPKELEDCAPQFYHHPAHTLPTAQVTEKTSAQILMGQAFDQVSPVKTFSKTLFLNFTAEQSDSFKVDFGCDEICVYPIAGEVKLDGQLVPLGQIAIFNHGEEVQFEMSQGAHFIVLGGTPHPEKRFMWWNFVSSEKEKIQKAAEKWKAQEFDRVPNETDWIPLPDDSYIML